MQTIPATASYGKSKVHPNKEHPASALMHLRDVPFSLFFLTFYFSLQLTPQPIPLVPSCLTPLMLRMDLFYMIGLLFDGSLEP